ncbi:MAG: LysR family transcriptional regulator [Rhizobiaceae bacterium]
MRLSGFNLNQLVCLEALLLERNVTKAALRVHLSQSAMSAVLAQLRDHFGDALLVKSGRALVLTPFAKSLIAPVNELLAQAQEFAARRPNQEIGKVDRELKLIASDYVFEACLADGIRRATKEIEGLRFDLLSLTENSARLLQNGEVDILFAGQSLDVGVPPNATIFEDKFVCVACSELGPRIGELSQETFPSFELVVVRYFEYQMLFEYEETLRRAGIPRQRQISIWSYSLVPHLVCASQRIAIVPERIAKKAEQRWPITVHPFPFSHEPVNAYAFWHTSRNSDRLLELFIDQLK